MSEMNLVDIRRMSGKESALLTPQEFTKIQEFNNPVDVLSFKECLQRCNSIDYQTLKIKDGNFVDTDDETINYGQSIEGAILGAKIRKWYNPDEENPNTDPTQCWCLDIGFNPNNNTLTSMFERNNSPHPVSNTGDICGTLPRCKSKDGVRYGDEDLPDNKNKKKLCPQIIQMSVLTKIKYGVEVFEGNPFWDIASDAEKKAEKMDIDLWTIVQISAKGSGFVDAMNYLKYMRSKDLIDETLYKHGITKFTCVQEKNKKFSWWRAMLSTLKKDNQVQKLSQKDMLFAKIFRHKLEELHLENLAASYKKTKEQVAQQGKDDDGTVDIGEGTVKDTTKRKEKADDIDDKQVNF